MIACHSDRFQPRYPAPRVAHVEYDYRERPAYPCGYAELVAQLTGNELKSSGLDMDLPKRVRPNASNITWRLSAQWGPDQRYITVTARWRGNTIRWRFV